jgi:hypothetical protein
MKLDSQNSVIFSSPLLINLKNAFLLKKRSFHTKIALFTKVPAILSLRNPKSAQPPVKFTLLVQHIIKTGHDIIKSTIILSKTTVLLSKQHLVNNITWLNNPQLQNSCKLQPMSTAQTPSQLKNKNTSYQTTPSPRTASHPYNPPTSPAEA